MKQVMHNVIAHYQETNAQHVPELQPLLPLTSSPSNIVSIMSYVTKYPLG